jgi:hypothetical protein
MVKVSSRCLVAEVDHVTFSPAGTHLELPDRSFADLSISVCFYAKWNAYTKDAAVIDLGYVV